MTNFIFKSQWTFKKISNQLDMIQSELRHQRIEHTEILLLLRKKRVDEHLQQQVDEYFEETPPQTDTENNDSD